MAKVLLIGQGLMPPELAENEPGRVSAPGIRAWHWAKALQIANHQVRILSIHPSQLNLKSTAASTEFSSQIEATTEAAITGGDFLPKVIADFRPDAVVAVSAWPAYLAALFLPEDLPLWADLFGSPLAEGQAKAVVTGDNSLLEPFARFEKIILRRADKISTVSSYQEYATIGALATHGRLNRLTDGYRFTTTIPATLDPATLPASSEPFLRGKIVPPDAFVVLWSGGFNTWTDIDTLFSGVEKAMAQNRHLHFVSTGGILPSHDAQTYPHFEKLVMASAYRERFHLLGWRPFHGLHNYYLESDAGIILDRWSYEGLLGSRTRLLDWLLYGLPAILTVTAELTEELSREGLAFSFPHGNALALAGLIARLANEKALLETAKDRAPAYIKGRFAYEIACKPLLDWLQNPQLSPDAGQILPEFSLASGGLERQLADYQAQLAAKNAQILQLEGWAKEMEKKLQNSSGLLTKIRKKLGR